MSMGEGGEERKQRGNDGETEIYNERERNGERGWEIRIKEIGESKRDKERKEDKKEKKGDYKKKKERKGNYKKKKGQKI